MCNSNYSPSIKHKLLLLVSCLQIIIFIAIANQALADSDGPKVDIHYTFKPEACERKAKPSDILTLHYKGSLENGVVFDSSHDREAFSFQLGTGQVIMGWEKGLSEACVGEKRKLVIPPELGYGEMEHGKIPAKSTLIFEIEVLDIKDGPMPANVFKEIDANGDKKLTREEVSEFLKKQLSHGGAATGEDAEHRQMVEEIFNHEDKDKDGEISFEEFSGPKFDHDEL